MSQSQLSRRQLLKILAAAAGTAALSSVPNKWKTPVVDVGMLPAHAQGLSGAGAITVIVNDQVTASPVKQSPHPPSTSTTCDLLTYLAAITIPTLSVDHCVDYGGETYPINNVPPGDYDVYCYTNFCFTPTSPQMVHVTAGGNPSVTFNIFGCPG